MYNNSRSHFRCFAQPQNTPYNHAYSMGGFMIPKGENIAAAFDGMMPEAFHPGIKQSSPLRSYPALQIQGGV